MTDTGLATLIIVAVLYFLPAMIAIGHKHHQKVAIFVLNLLLGWTILGWVGAMVWAFVRPSPAARPVDAN